MRHGFGYSGYGRSAGGGGIIQGAVEIVVFDPVLLDLGIWLDPSDPTTVFQDSAGTTPADIDDQVAYLADKSGNGFHFIQTNGGKLPTLRQSGALIYLEFVAGSGDFLFCSSYTGVDPSTFVLGARVSDKATAIFDSHTNTQCALFHGDPGGSDNKFGVIRGGSVIEIAESTADCVHTVKFDGSTTTYRLNGAGEVSGSAGTNLHAGMRIGDIRADLVGGWSLDGRFYGMVDAHELVVGAELDDLEAWMAEKTGVTL